MCGVYVVHESHMSALCQTVLFPEIMEGELTDFLRIFLVIGEVNLPGTTLAERNESNLQVRMEGCLLLRL